MHLDPSKNTTKEAKIFRNEATEEIKKPLLEDSRDGGLDFNSIVLFRSRRTSASNDTNQSLQDDRTSRIYQFKSQREVNESRVSVQDSELHRVQKRLDEFHNILVGMKSAVVASNNDAKEFATVLVSNATNPSVSYSQFLFDDVTGPVDDFFDFTSSSVPEPQFGGGRPVAICSQSGGVMYTMSNFHPRRL